MRDFRRWMPWVTLVVDALLINVAFVVAYWLRYDLQLFGSVDPANNVPYKVYWPLVGLLLVILLLINRREGAYDLRRGSSLFDEFYGVINATTTSIMLLVVLVFFYRRLFYSRIIFIYAGIMIVVLLTVARVVRNMIMARMRQAGMGVDRVLIVGAGEAGRTVMRNLMAQPELGYRVIGFLDDNPGKNTDIGPIMALGPVDNLFAVTQQYAIDQVIITLPWQYHRKIVHLMTECGRVGAQPRVVPDLFQLSLGSVDVEAINGIPLISLKQTSLTGLNLAVKRAFDLVLTVIALICIAPLWLVIAVAIRLDSPGPVLFSQPRAGRYGKPFTVFKFRSMYVNAEAELEKLRARNEASGPLFKLTG